MSDLIEAARRGDCRRLVSLIAQGANTEELDSVGRTSLHFSSLCGPNKCTEVLLSAGANPNAADENGYTPLHLATLADLAEAATQIDALVKAGAKVKARLRGDRVYEQVRDWTPLMLAASEGSALAMRALPKTLADVNATDWAGMTPLILAVCQTSETEEKVKLLLEAGADKRVRSYEGKSALDYAREGARKIDEGQHDPVVQQSMREMREQISAKLKNSGISFEGVQLPDIGAGISKAMDQWPRVIELLGS